MNDSEYDAGFKAGVESERERAKAPTVVLEDGTKEWRAPRGKLHREGAPARIHPNGSQEWWRYGRRHRWGGPAVVYPDLSVWFVHGKIHRRRGPAVVWAGGGQQWYIRGVRQPDREVSP